MQIFRDAANILRVGINKKEVCVCEWERER